MTKKVTGSTRGSGRPPAGAHSVRDALLRAAASHFSTYGYAGASIRSILTDAGTTAPAMYHHFTNKTGLYLAAATAAEDHVLASFEAATADRSGGADKVSALLNAAVELRREHPNVARYLSVIQQDVARNPELAELNSYETRFDEFWRSSASEWCTPASAVALRAVVEGLLSVGGAHISIEDVGAAAEALTAALRGGFVDR